MAAPELPVSGIDRCGRIAKFPASCLSTAATAPMSFESNAASSIANFRRVRLVFAAADSVAALCAIASRYLRVTERSRSPHGFVAGASPSCMRVLARPAAALFFRIWNLITRFAIEARRRLALVRAIAGRSRCTRV